MGLSPLALNSKITHYSQIVKRLAFLDFSLAPEYLVGANQKSRYMSK